MQIKLILTLSRRLKRSTKITGKCKRVNVNTKAILYQFTIGDLAAHEALYKKHEICKHLSNCCNPHHVELRRKQQYNGKRRRTAIKAQVAEHGMKSLKQLKRLREEKKKEEEEAAAAK